MKKFRFLPAHPTALAPWPVRGLTPRRRVAATNWESNCYGIERRQRPELSLAPQAMKEDFGTGDEADPGLFAQQHEGEMAEMDVPSAPPRTALVLSGGGARGAYEAGVVSQLYAQDETFDVICGTSIGAINGAFIAQRPAAETLRAIWSTIHNVGVVKEIPLVQSAQKVLADLQAAQSASSLKKVGDLFHSLEDARGLFPLSQFLAISGGLDPSPVVAFLKANLNFAQLCLPFIFAATNLTHGASQVFYKFPDDWAGKDDFVKAEGDAIALNGDSYAEAVRASGAIPVAFPPVAIPALPAEQSGSQFVDGGLANNTPIGQAVDAGADRITVIFMDPATDGPDHYPSGNLVQIVSACYEVMVQKILQADFDLALRTNKLAETGPASGKRVVELREIRPKAALPLTILDFDKQDLIDRAFALGVEDAKNAPLYRT